MPKSVGSYASSKSVLLARIECILEHGLVVLAGIRLKRGSPLFLTPTRFSAVILEHPPSLSIAP